MIGGVLTISGLTGISLHTPVGALIDATRRKRELIIAGVVLLALSAVAIERRRRPWSVRHLVAPGAGRCDAWYWPLRRQPGVIGIIQGIGGSLSNGVAGLIVVRAGYDTAFLALAALAAMALLLVWVAMPETRGSQSG
jgi:hypothetical protein